MILKTRKERRVEGNETTFTEMSALNSSKEPESRTIELSASVIMSMM